MQTKNLFLGAVKLNAPTREEKDSGKGYGFLLKRDLEYGECEHVLQDLLGLHLYSRIDCISEQGYQFVKNGIVKAANKWLKGECRFDDVLEDCCPEDFRYMSNMFGMVIVTKYLMDKDIIEQ